eukprot:TRINITY_DN896_c1_g2_i1.p2 TRINITY_DN896_c1_g2~~TRINITY_DN896_c1_g2_i1.p2  ORF type:complete len:588 (+),score=60.69 TRINITY_DN896_c1_g2_i1:262-2025(+)
MAVQSAGSFEARLSALLRGFLMEEMGKNEKKVIPKEGRPKGKSDRTERKWQKVQPQKEPKKSQRQAAKSAPNRGNYYAALTGTSNTQDLSSDTISSPPRKPATNLPSSWRSISLRDEDWNLPVIPATDAFSSPSCKEGIFFCTTSEAKIIQATRTGDFATLTHQPLEDSVKVSFPVLIGDRVASRTGWLTSHGDTKAKLQVDKRTATQQHSILMLQYHAGHSKTPRSEVTPSKMKSLAHQLYENAFADEEITLDSHLVFFPKKTEANKSVKTVNMRVPRSRAKPLLSYVAACNPLQDGFFLGLPNFTREDLKITTVTLNTTDIKTAKHLGSTLKCPTYFLRSSKRLLLFCSRTTESAVRKSLGDHALPPLPEGDKYRVSGTIVGRMSRAELIDCCNDHGWDVELVSHYTKPVKGSNRRSSCFIVVSKKPPPSRTFWFDNDLLTINPLVQPKPSLSDYPALSRGDSASSQSMDEDSISVVDSEQSDQQAPPPYSTAITQSSQADIPQLIQEIQKLVSTVNSLQSELTGLRAELTAEKARSSKLSKELRDRLEGRQIKLRKAGQRPRSLSTAMSRQLDHNEQLQAGGAQ